MLAKGKSKKQEKNISYHNREEQIRKKQLRRQAAHEHLQMVANKKRKKKFFDEWGHHFSVLSVQYASLSIETELIDLTLFAKKRNIQFKLNDLRHLFKKQENYERLSKTNESVIDEWEKDSLDYVRNDVTEKIINLLFDLIGSEEKRYQLLHLICKKQRLYLKILIAQLSHILYTSTNEISFQTDIIITIYVNLLRYYTDDQNYIIDHIEEKVPHIDDLLVFQKKYLLIGIEKYTRESLVSSQSLSFIEQQCQDILLCTKQITHHFGMRFLPYILFGRLSLVSCKELLSQLYKTTFMLFNHIFSDKEKSIPLDFINKETLFSIVHLSVLSQNSILDYRIAVNDENIFHGELSYLLKFQLSFYNALKKIVDARQALFINIEFVLNKTSIQTTINSSEFKVNLTKEIVVPLFWQSLGLSVFPMLYPEMTLEMIAKSMLLLFKIYDEYAHFFTKYDCLSDLFMRSLITVAPIAAITASINEDELELTKPTVYVLEAYKRLLKNYYEIFLQKQFPHFEDSLEQDEKYAKPAQIISKIIEISSEIKAFMSQENTPLTIHLTQELKILLTKIDNLFETQLMHIAGEGKLGTMAYMGVSTLFYNAQVIIWQLGRQLAVKLELAIVNLNHAKKDYSYFSDEVVNIANLFLTEIVPFIERGSEVVAIFKDIHLQDTRCELQSISQKSQAHSFGVEEEYSILARKLKTLRWVFIINTQCYKDSTLFKRLTKNYYLFLEHTRQNQNLKSFFLDPSSDVDSLQLPESAVHQPIELAEEIPVTELVAYIKPSIKENSYSSSSSSYKSKHVSIKSEERPFLKKSKPHIEQSKIVEVKKKKTIEEEPIKKTYKPPRISAPLLAKDEIPLRDKNNPWKISTRFVCQPPIIAENVRHIDGFELPICLIKFMQSVQCILAERLTNSSFVLFCMGTFVNGLIKQTRQSGKIIGNKLPGNDIDLCAIPDLSTSNSSAPSSLVPLLHFLQEEKDYLTTLVPLDQQGNRMHFSVALLDNIGGKDPMPKISADFRHCQFFANCRGEAYVTDLKALSMLENDLLEPTDSIITFVTQRPVSILRALHFLLPSHNFYWNKEQEMEIKRTINSHLTLAIFNEKCNWIHIYKKLLDYIGRHGKAFCQLLLDYSIVGVLFADNSSLGVGQMCPELSNKLEEDTLDIFSSFVLRMWYFLKTQFSVQLLEHDYPGFLLCIKNEANKQNNQRIIEKMDILITACTQFWNYPPPLSATESMRLR